MKADRLIEFLKGRDIHLILVDVGASGELWEAFQMLLPVADLLRFDPDLRAMQTVESKEGCKRVTVNKAVTDSSASEVEFFLTKSPYCSSTLQPDLDRIREYAYEDLFEVVGESKLPATTLAQALGEAGLKRIDWLKLDTQGTELRIVRSLPRSLLDRLLVCDVEASLYEHYLGADLMPDIQRFFTAEEFWITSLVPHLRTRMSRPQRDELQTLESSGFLRRVQQSAIHQAPTTLELTYARTLRGARKVGLDEEGLIRLFACHYALGAFEYCFQIVGALREGGAPEQTAQSLADITLAAIRERTRQTMPAYAVSALKNRAAGLWGKIFR